RSGVSLSPPCGIVCSGPSSTRWSSALRNGLQARCRLPAHPRYADRLDRTPGVREKLLRSRPGGRKVGGSRRFGGLHEERRRPVLTSACSFVATDGTGIPAVSARSCAVTANLLGTSARARRTSASIGLPPGPAMCRTLLLLLPQ